MDDVAETTAPDEPMLETQQAVIPELGAVFPEPTLEQWRGLVDRVLDRSGKADRLTLDRRFEQRLVSTTEDGIRVDPLYTRADGAPEAGMPGAAPFVRGATAAGPVVSGWDVRQSVDATTAAAGAVAVLAELEGGANSVVLRVGAGHLNADDLREVLAGVHLELAGIVLDGDSDAAAVDAARALVALWTERLADPADALGSLGLDPIGAAARTGTDPDLAPSLAMAADHAATFSGISTLLADGRVVHEAGGSDAEELGYVLAVGAEYLRALEAAGVGLDDAARTIELHLTATADQFGTIAKLRAARRAWSRLTTVAGVSAVAQAPRLQVSTSWAMTTRRDPWVNILRTTVAAFGAAAGGAGAITVLPFDAAVGRPDAFGARVARNVQALLLEESSVGRVIDPAGGSWFVERLTDDVTEAAWTWFRDIESVGGVEAALGDGTIAERVAATRAQRSDAIAHRTRPLTGVSEFPQADDEPLVRPPDPGRPGGGLPRVRYAEPFEVLRDAADAAVDRGQAPGIRLLALGSVAASTARATFAKNFFEAGGIRTTSATVADVGDLAANSLDDTVVCLCSSDDVYAEQAADIARAAKASGATRVVLAGAPGASEDAWRSAGVDEFIHVGVDVLAVLDRTLNHLGVHA